MPKRTIYTQITPLAPQVTRDIVVDMLHDHDLMIELNPLVIEHKPCQPPANAEAEEYAKCKWQILTDRVSYLPGGMATGKVSYHASFFDLPVGIQTHIYAPLGLDIRGKWTVGGNMPGEPRVAEELGLNVPREGLYLREDVDMKCNMLMTGFVRKNLDKAHSVLVSRLLAKSEFIENIIHSQSRSGITSPNTGPRTFSSSGSYTGSSPSMDQNDWRRGSALTVQSSIPNTQIHELAPPTPVGPVELPSESAPAVPRKDSVGQNNANYNNVEHGNQDWARNRGFSDARSANLGITSPHSVYSQGSSHVELSGSSPNDVSTGYAQRHSGSGNTYTGVASPGLLRNQGTGQYDQGSIDQIHGSVNNASTGMTSPDSFRGYGTGQYDKNLGAQSRNSNNGANQMHTNPTNIAAGSNQPAHSMDSGFAPNQRFSYDINDSVETDNSTYGHPGQNVSGINTAVSSDMQPDKTSNQRAMNPFTRRD